MIRSSAPADLCLQRGTGDVLDAAEGAGELVDEVAVGAEFLEGRLPLPHLHPYLVHELDGLALAGRESGKVADGVVQGGKLALRTDLQV